MRIQSVTLDVLRPNKPTDNAFIKWLNRKYRAECPTASWFMRPTNRVQNASLGAETTTRCVLMPVWAD